MQFIANKINKLKKTFALVRGKKVLVLVIKVVSNSVRENTIAIYNTNKYFIVIVYTKRF